MAEEFERPPQIRAGTLTERESKNGGIYLTGWWGPIKLTAMPSKFKDKFGNPQWSLLISENPPKRTDRDEEVSRGTEEENGNGRRKKAPW